MLVSHPTNTTQTSSNYEGTQSRDVFPLNLNRSWEYSFQLHISQARDILWNWYGYSDSGSVKYSIIDSVTYTDSVDWGIKVIRSFRHNEFDQSKNFDTTYFLRDSSVCHLRELLIGGHQLFADTVNYARNPIWRFMRQHNVYRYQETDSEGLASLLLSIQVFPYVPTTLSAFYFKSDSGLVRCGLDLTTISTHLSQSASLLKYGLTSVTRSKESSQTATRHYLNPVFPNPFNSAATISFVLPKSSLVTITIFNAFGQKVSTIVNNRLISGRYSYSWNAENLASGMYFIKLNSDNYTETTKCLLLK
jgi:hypothetical protein